MQTQGACTHAAAAGPLARASGTAQQLPNFGAVAPHAILLILKILSKTTLPQLEIGVGMGATAPGFGNRRGCAMRIVRSPASAVRNFVSPAAPWLC